MSTPKKSQPEVPEGLREVEVPAVEPGAYPERPYEEARAQ